MRSVASDLLQVLHNRFPALMTVAFQYLCFEKSNTLKIYLQHPFVTRVLEDFCQLNHAGPKVRLLELILTYFI
jgi:hypothetical protein